MFNINPNAFVYQKGGGGGYFFTPVLFHFDEGQECLNDPVYEMVTWLIHQAGIRG